MNYKFNEQGEVAIRGEKGELKYVNKKLAEDKQLMKTMHFEIVELPDAFVIEEKTEDIPVIEIKTEVAETTPAQRGRKSNNK